MNLKNKLNHYGKNRIPFFFVISYDMSEWDVIPLDNLPDDISYSIDQYNTIIHNMRLDISPLSFIKYKKMFDKVIQNIKEGNTYLCNLTSQTKITNNQNLKDIYLKSDAKYKLYYRDKFLSFSPESFIKIENDKINTFPMKGTIDADINNAKEVILSNQKEFAEHIMIVDLLRNDLSIVSSSVKVKKFRYTEEIKAGDKKLLQVSSHIQGQLNRDWHEYLGDILTSLLPAGSISGTPKRKTIELIKQIENYDRGFFTGIWGIYDGVSLDSAVLIRFIEKLNSEFSYKSGGGITLDSDCKSEYHEMIDKIYIP